MVGSIHDKTRTYKYLAKILIYTLIIKVYINKDLHIFKIITEKLYKFRTNTII